MEFFTDLIPKSGTFADPGIERSVSSICNALKNGTQSNLNEDLRKLVTRIEQAGSKIQSGIIIRRLSEFLTLGKFGAGSVGRALAEIFEDESVGQICEELFIARFITQTAIQADRYPNLIPEEVLQIYHVDRAELTTKKASPVYVHLFDRAKQIIRGVPAHLNSNTPETLAIYLLRHRLFTRKQISKLSGRNPIGCNVRLSVWEHSCLVPRMRYLIGTWSQNS